MSSNKTLDYIILAVAGALIGLAMIAADSAHSKPLVVAIIDDGYNVQYRDQLNLCKHIKEQVYVGTSGMRDSTGHGTNIGGLVVGTSKAKASEYCLNYYKIFDENGSNKRSNDFIARAVRQATKDGAKIINMSLSGKGFRKDEYLAMAAAVKAGVVLMVAAGNESINLDQNCNTYPACYPLPLIVVGNGKYINVEINKAAKKYVVAVSKHKSSNYGKLVQVWLPGCETKSLNGTMCGSSQSTAIATGQALDILLQPKGGKK